MALGHCADGNKLDLCDPDSNLSSSSVLDLAFNAHSESFQFHAIMHIGELSAEIYTS